MIFFEILIGRNFLMLINAGKAAQKSIKEGGEKLCQQSSPELEKYYSLPVFMQDTPNALSPGGVCLLFMIIYAWGNACTLNYYPIPPQLNVELFFIPFIIISPFIGLLPSKIGQGSLLGLFILLSLFFLGILIALTTLFHILYFGMSNEWRVKDLGLIPIQATSLYLIRKIMNGASFAKLVSFYRTRRIVQESYKFKNNKCRNKK